MVHQTVKSSVPPKDCEAQKNTTHTIAEAIEVIGVGKVQILAVIAGTLCLMNYLLDVIGAGLILPAATCDLQLDTYKKGLLTGAPFLGFILTGHLWGFLTDTIGRQRSVIISLTSSICITAVAALIPNYWVILVLKLCSGMAMSGATCAMYPYVGEILTSSKRSKFMLIIGYAPSFAMILMSIVGWLMIRYGSTVYLYNYAISPWRFQMIILTIPGAIGAFMFFYLPESAKFLSSIGEGAKALEALKEIHQRNCNGKDPFPILALEEERAHSVDKNTFASVMKSFFRETKLLFQRPFLWPMVNICFIIYGLLTVGAAFAIWYPELTNRLSGNESGGKVCDVFGEKGSNTTVATAGEINWDECVVDIQDKMFLDNLIVGLGYFVINAIYYVCSSRVKISTIMITSMGLSSLCGIILPSLSDDIWIMVCFTLFIIGSGAAILVFSILVVEIFPTFNCGMALSICLLVGRLGTVIGTNGFGVLLEANCEFTIYGVAMLIGAGALCIFALPKKIQVDVK